MEIAEGLTGNRETEGKQPTNHHLTGPTGLTQDEFEYLKQFIIEHHTYYVAPEHVNVISGLPAATSTERLDILDDDRYITGFSITGGEHRLRNYRSVTTVHEFDHHDGKRTVVLESYIVDVPEGNTGEDTLLFADTVVRLNLQKLASVVQRTDRDGNGDGKSLVG
ncbi:Abscisic acid receptor like [Quillaja saponaria]|uniref:Abscisic acid receptor like n=1 Tax=Quillaja saponaria TaxID=32244 RepID=A0AAD7KPV4_QUISA|nr:Abscisic acid receptor like [Quillaja saponaria]